MLLHRWIGRYGLTLGTVDGDWLMASALDGTFRIDRSRKTISCFVADPSRPDWLDVFVRRVLPRVAILAGAGALHAAAVAADGGALLLLGESGAGKSTLAAALGNAGWDVLGEDIAIMWEAEAPQVAPATTGVCVWEDSRRGLRLDDARCTPMPGYDGKVHFTSGHDVATSPVPLRAFVFLSRSPDAAGPALHRLSGAEGMIRAARQRIRFNPADDGGGETRAMFARLSMMARATPCFRLVYPADYAALPAVEAALRRLVRG